MKPNGTKELFRQHKIGLDEARALEELSDNTGADDKFLYEACGQLEMEAEELSEEFGDGDIGEI